MSELPKGWKQVEIGDVSKVVSGGTPKASICENFCEPSDGGHAWLTPADLSGYKPKMISHGKRNITDKGLKESSARLMPEGSILFSSRAPIGYVAIAENEISTNQGFKSFVFTDEVVPSYAYYYLKSIRGLAESWGTGTTFKELSSAKAKKLPFFYPSIDEQKRIADKLDSVLAKVEAAQARLDKIPTILKRFRQSVLAAATSGELTREWRNNHEAIVKNPTLGTEKINESIFRKASRSLPVTPSSWLIVPAGKVLEYVTSGSRGWSKYYSTNPNDALFLRMSNVRYDTTKLILSDLQYVDLPEKVEGKRSLVKLNDLVVSITADVGRVARITEEITEAYINQHLALLRPTSEINSEFLAMCIASTSIGISQVNELKRGATKAGLGLDDIRNLAIPLPSLAEQAEIVATVNKFFEQAFIVEKQYNAAKTRLDKLTQSILTKAFKGELLTSPVESEIKKIESSVEAIHA